MPVDLKAVVAQINFCVGDVMGNVEKVIHSAKCAIQEHQPDCIIFPEMALSGYPPEDLVFRADFLHQCQIALKKIQQAALPSVLIVGYPVQINNHIYNQAAVIRNGEIIAVYNKQELPNYTVFDEKRYFYPGNAPCVFSIKGIKIGLLICEDVWFPRPLELTMREGAQLVIAINASPFDYNKAQIRESILSERAHEARAPIIYANLVGGQDELVFDGGSFVVDSNGQR